MSGKRQSDKPQYYDGPTIEDLTDRQHKAQQFVEKSGELIEALENLEAKYEDITESVDDDLVDNYPGDFDMSDFVQRLKDSMQQHEGLVEEITGG